MRQRTRGVARVGLLEMRHGVFAERPSALALAARPLRVVHLRRLRAVRHGEYESRAAGRDGGRMSDDERAEALRMFHEVRERLRRFRFEVEALESLFWRLAAIAGASYEELVAADPAREARDDGKQPA